ncbi:hypothetical protein E3E12_08010 [Formicincola oecophyllae]|uniref:Glycine-rich domain-containing protein n=1 Tax=Formicincola oecophyllae TaxID=2558361 RepID=A0A4Y6UB16_9PROT|nr:hypothetical protein [Formicincola oecophyllae]QDH14140.1 hypothetical protein E3E12_08010 [Formicincola oecophyllae]
MKASTLGPTFTQGWAYNPDLNTVRAIPESAPGDKGAASLEKGFPEATMTPVGAGGEPPNGADMNGALRLLSLGIRQGEARPIPPWDGNLANAIGGYPQGACVMADLGGQWSVLVSLRDDNLAQPTDTGSWQNLTASCQPKGFYVPTGGADDGLNRPVTFMGVDDRHGQLWFNADGLMGQFLVTGNYGLDNYSFRCVGLKSQYQDPNTRSQPAGLEYFDENGLATLAIAKPYADAIYATQAALNAEINRAEASEGTKVSGTEGMVNGDGRGIGLHTNGSTNHPIYGDDKNGWRDLALVADLAGYQPKGNYVPNVGADDGQNRPITLMGVDDAVGQLWFQTTGQGGLHLVAGDSGTGGDLTVKALVFGRDNLALPTAIARDGTRVEMALRSDLVNEINARQSADSAERTRAQNVEATLLSGTAGLVSGDVQGIGIHTQGGSNQPLYGDIANGWRALALESDLAGYQPKGNYVPSVGADDGQNGPITMMGVADGTGQLWFNTAKASNVRLVAGNQFTDAFSLPVHAIKSQYLDTDRKQPAGLEYIDENGLFMLAISKAYADGLYATQSALTAEINRAQGVEATLLSGTAGRGPNDPSGLALHTNAGTGRPNYWDSTGGKGDLAYYTDVSAEAAARMAADNAETTRAQGVEATLLSGTSGMASGDVQGIGIHTQGGSNQPLYGDITNGWRALALESDLARYQPKGNYVPSVGADDGQNGPITMMGVADGTGQLWFNTAKTSNVRLVAGNQFTDAFSLPVHAIKSQYLDTDRKQPAGLEYIDENGLFMLALSKAYADGLYASIPSLVAETNRAQQVEATMLSGTFGMGPNDNAGVGIHTSSVSGRPTYWDKSGNKGDLAYFAEVSAEAAARVAADNAETARAQGVEATLLSGRAGMASGDVQGIGIHTNSSSGHPTYGDVSNGWRDLALVTDVTSEASARQSADSALGGRVDGEVTARQNADNALHSGINQALRVVRAKPLTVTADGTFTVQQGVGGAIVELVGGGGAGGSNDNGSGAGGGGGAYVRAYLPLAAGQQFSVSIGKGSSPGAHGGDTRLTLNGNGQWLVAGGGECAHSGDGASAGGVGGSVSMGGGFDGANIIVTSNGNDGADGKGVVNGHGNGAPGPWGGAGRAGNGNGYNAEGPGAGGGGAYAAGVGGVGQDGIAIITWLPADL